MKIQYALKETGKITCEGYSDYAELDNRGRLIWKNRRGDTYTKDGGKFVRLSAITDYSWIPYHPEPELCEHCQDADYLRTFSNDSHQTKMQIKHLRFHCACKEDN
jgi:hypothetical protein